MQMKFHSRASATCFFRLGQIITAATCVFLVLCFFETYLAYRGHTGKSIVQAYLFNDQIPLSEICVVISFMSHVFLLSLLLSEVLFVIVQRMTRFVDSELEKEYSNNR